MIKKFIRMEFRSDIYHSKRMAENRYYQRLSLGLSFVQVLYNKIIKYNFQFYRKRYQRCYFNRAPLHKVQLRKMFL